MSKTEKNLKDAFAGESQANRKYLAFAQKAQTEGYPQVAKLFRAAAEAETVHAHTHLRTLKGVKSTLENLKEAHGGETYEFQSMYPPMIAEAKAEGNEAAVRTFTYANEVEKSTPRSTRRRSTLWGKTRRPWITTSARCAALPARRKPRRSARSARPRKRSS